MGPKVTSQPMKTLPSSGEVWHGGLDWNPPDKIIRQFCKIVIQVGRFHISISSSGGAWTTSTKDQYWFTFMCHLWILSRHLFDASRSRRVEHWFTTTPTGSISGLHQKTPVQLPRQVSQGSVFCIAPQFAFLPQIFRATGSAASKPAGAPRLCSTCASISKAIRAEIKHLWIFLNNVA